MSPRTSSGGGDSLAARDGYVETNGRKKRRTAAPEDGEYMPPGTKRVSGPVALLYFQIFIIWIANSTT